MNTRLATQSVALALLLVLGLTACVSSVASRELTEIPQQIRAAVEKTFPLPAQVTIRTHIGDDVRFATVLSLDEVVAFYRAAYATKGFVEQTGTQVSAGQAALRFAKNAEKDVVLNVNASQPGSEVHLWLEAP